MSAVKRITPAEETQRMTSTVIAGPYGELPATSRTRRRAHDATDGLRGELRFVISGQPVIDWLGGNRNCCNRTRSPSRSG